MGFMGISKILVFRREMGKISEIKIENFMKKLRDSGSGVGKLNRNLWEMGKMSEIKVKRDTRLTFYDVSIKRLCDMSYYISEMLKILYSIFTDNIKNNTYIKYFKN